MLRPSWRRRLDYDRESNLEELEIDERLVRLGQQGLSRAEIAVALGLSLEALREREASDRAFATGLARAAAAREAWWHSRVRELLIERFDLQLYIAEFQWRFPGEPMPWEPTAPPKPAPAPRWRRRRAW